MVWDVFHFNLSKPYGDKNIKSCNPFMGTKLYAMREVEPYGGHVLRQLSCQLVNGIYPLTPNMERWINFTLTFNFYLFNFNLASKFKNEYLNWFFPSERKKKIRISKLVLEMKGPSTSSILQNFNKTCLYIYIIKCIFRFVVTKIHFVKFVLLKSELLSNKL